MRMLKRLLFSVFIPLCAISFNAHSAGLSLASQNGFISKMDHYLTLRPDVRRCASPICGGWFVSAVNTKVLRCPDNSVKRECYVGADKVNIPGLTAEQIAQLKRAMSESRALILGHLSNSVPYGVLNISSAWLAPSLQKPEGVFLNVSDNGIRCITSPCPSFDGEVLNKRHVKTLASYDISGVKATDEQLTEARLAVSGEGLPLVGKFVEVTGPAGTAQGVVASQFYLKLQSKSPKSCRPTGCSSQVCSDTDVITTCEFRPEYACYRNAVCTTQENGDCGWVMDAELIRCLEETSGSLLK